MKNNTEIRHFSATNVLVLHKIKLYLKKELTKKKESTIIDVVKILF